MADATPAKPVKPAKTSTKKRRDPAITERLRARRIAKNNAAIQKAKVAKPKGEQPRNRDRAYEKRRSQHGKLTRQLIDLPMSCWGRTFRHKLANANLASMQRGFKVPKIPKGTASPAKAE